MTYRSKGLPVERYLASQGRYRHLSQEQIDSIQAEVDRNWAEIARRDEAPGR
ncbi:MAG TPA: hypothetical protein VK997_00535 [Deferrisomatales bacterium]|nr:hypothetical protein [Deferrisomatales bacterium]